MIDYSKLKIAHELAEKYERDIVGKVCVSVTFFNVENNPMYELYVYETHPLPLGIVDKIKHSWWDIDSLIATLHQLTQPVAKYADGQQVWFIDCTKKDGIIRTGKVIYSERREYLFGEYKYFVNFEEGYYVPEDCVYPTKAALIEAQLRYWQKLYNDEKCRHGLVEAQCVPCSNEINIEHEFKKGICIYCGDSYMNHSPVCVRDECQHEPQKDFIHPGSPGFKKGHVQMCIKCNEEYVPDECQHESDGQLHTVVSFGACVEKINKCTKCGEFYR